MAFIQMSLYSRCLQRTVPVNCIIPVDSTDYLSQPLPEEKPLKTLYLLNGFFGNQNDWVLAGEAAILAKEFNLAIIMPAGENHFYIDDGHGEYHGRFIGEELVEMTRRLFPLSRKREDTFIGGLSMGGYGALRNGLLYHETFSRIVALSPGIFTSAHLEAMSSAPDPANAAFFGADALFMNRRFLENSFGDFAGMDGSGNDVYALFTKAAESKTGAPDIYMACGTEDTLFDSVKRYAVFLQEHNAPLTWVEDHGIHDFLYWNTHLRDALEHFLPLP
ncbi:MAG: acetylesterase [Solobacterium sp.]|nr:acetylesterase [Solobacterium sp.]